MHCTLDRGPKTTTTSTLQLIWRLTESGVGMEVPLNMRMSHESTCYIFIKTSRVLGLMLSEYLPAVVECSNRNAGSLNRERSKNNNR